jgi:hypothetical protein
VLFIEKAVPLLSLPPVEVSPTKISCAIAVGPAAATSIMQNRRIHEVLKKCVVCAVRDAGLVNNVLK